jgi:hypothetical protein
MVLLAGDRGVTLGLTRRLPAVRKQATELPGRRRRQAREHVLQVRPWLDAQALARRREAEEHRRRFAAARRPYCQPVLATYGDTLHLSLGDIVVYGQEARLGVT